MTKKSDAPKRVASKKTATKKTAAKKEPKVTVAVVDKPMQSLPFLVDAALAIEHVRVGIQVRHSHLGLQGRVDPETEEVLRRLKENEEYVDDRVAELIQQHPAYPWFSRVKGVGKENIGKVVGLVDITKAPMVSSLWKFCGYSVENGKAPKRVKGGGKLSYNSQLRSMCWRLATSLMKAGGHYYDYYVAKKDEEVARLTAQGVKIVPASKLPKKDGKVYEPEGMISEGHIHNRALRRMIKLFLSHLWHVWREAEGLPTRPPYVFEHLGHTHIIDPWTMVDREEKKLAQA